MNTPKAPDPYQTAAAQTASNKQTAQTQQELNMTNQVNPFGSLSYSQSGTNPDGTPQYAATTSYAPAVQQLLTGFQGLQGRQQAAASNLLNSGAGALGGKGLDLSYNGTAAALDDLNRKRLDPQWQQNQQQLESKLAAQGLTPGTAAYDNQVRNFNVAKNDAYNSANLADYQTAANTAERQYNDPLSAYTTLASGTNPQLPQFTNTPTVNVPGTNIAGLIEDNYKNQLSQSNAAMGGMFGLGGTVLGAALGGPVGAGLGGSLGNGLGGLFGYGSSSSPGYGNFGQYSPNSPMNGG